MADAVRLGVVLTHPIQYFAPWFRSIARDRPDIDLTVFYAVRPTAPAQAEGFGGAFEWDDDLTAGYRCDVLSPARSATPLLAEQFSVVDAPALDARLKGQHAVLIPGWHASVYRRASRVCREHGIPTIYRGDSTLLTGPAGPARLLWRARTRSRLREYSAWLAVGQRSREYLAEFRVDEPLTFDSPHAVDNAAFAAGAAPWQRSAARAEVRRRFGLDPAAFVALFVGKLATGKRPLDLVRALARLDSSPILAQALFVGAGEMVAACREEASRLGVTAAFAGFLNQRDVPHAYAAADCLVLPSESETWGLVVNEAMAAGVPCVISDRVGCAPDLVPDAATGAVVSVGDAAALARALGEIRDRLAGGHDFAAACRTRVASYSFQRATEGLAASLERLDRRTRSAAMNRSGQPRVIACCGNMVIAGGLERQTFAVLGALRAAGAAAHAIVNTWESARIVSLAEQRDVAWSTGYYWHEISRHIANPVRMARLLWDMVRTSAGLLSDARAFGATSVLVPEWHAAVRNWPGLAWLRLRGTRVVLRVGNAPGEGRLHRWLWRWMFGAAVDTFGCNSRYFARAIEAHGIPAARVCVIHNAAARQWPDRMPRPLCDPHLVVYVGQFIPLKGLLVLLDAIALLRARNIAARLDVIGDIDGWEAPAYAGFRAQVKARAAQADLAGAVNFLGQREDVLERLARAAVHCCPSLPELREGLAGVVLEAKEAGVPSVVMPTGSLPEMIEHGVDGWVAKSPTVEALTEGLERFLRDPAERARASAAALDSRARFSPQAFARGWRAAFDPAPSS